MRDPFPKALWGWNAPNDPAQVLKVEPEADMVAKPRSSADPSFTVRIAHSHVVPRIYIYMYILCLCMCK